MLFRTDKLIAFHGDGDFENIIGKGLFAAQHFSETSNADQRMVAGESNQVFNFAADLDLAAGGETNASRTDVQRLPGTIYLFVTELQDFERELEFVSLCTTLFHLFNVVPFTFGINGVPVPISTRRINRRLQSREGERYRILRRG